MLSQADKNSLNKKKIEFKKILIVQTAFIGDVILSLPLVQEAKQLFKNAQIHFLTIPKSQNIIETHPDICWYWIFDKHHCEKGILSFLKVAKKLRNEKYDLALVPHRSLRSAMLPFIAKIPLRIGYRTSSGFFLFNYRINYSTNLHESDRNLQFLKLFQYENNNRVFPQIYPDLQDKQKVNSWIKGNLGINDIIALAPGSVWPTKQWPLNYWLRLAKEFSKNNFEVVFIGAEEDRKILLPFLDQLKSNQIKENMGQFTLRQTSYFLSKCKLLISNDSAPTHLSVAARTPVITIYGPTIPGFGFYPYGERDQIAELKNLDCRPCSIHGGKKCPQKHFRCMLNLMPETIKKIAGEILNENFKN